MLFTHHWPHVRYESCQSEQPEVLGASQTFVLVQTTIFVLSGPRKLVCAKSHQCPKTGKTEASPLSSS